MLTAQQKYLSTIKQVIEYFKKYELDNSNNNELLFGIENFKVTTPIIGGFSTGKSTLINTLLERNILPTDITPETAIPTEIFLSDIEKAEKLENKEWKGIEIKELVEKKYKYDNVKLIRANVNNDFLKSINNVKIVDIPGLDSGNEAHDIAINNYLQNSLAYIVAVDIEQGATESVLNFLKELKLINMPVLIVLTKIDKKIETDVKAMVNNVKVAVASIIGEGKFSITETSARNKNLGELKAFLQNIQKDAENIFVNKYRTKINYEISEIAKYLNTRINKQDFTIEEIDEQIVLLNKQIEELKQNLIKEKGKLATDIQKCLDVARGKIRMSLESAVSQLTTDAINNKDLKQTINAIGRTAIIESIQSEISPRLQRYLKNITQFINIDVNINTNFQSNDVNTNSKVDDLAKEGIKKTLTVALTSLGFVISGPIGSLIGMAISFFTELFFNNKKKENVRYEVESKIRSEVIPQAAEQISSNFTSSVNNYIEEIQAEIEESINKDKEFKEKALNDLKIQKANEEAKQKQIIEEMKNDIEKLSSLTIN